MHLQIIKDNLAKIQLTAEALGNVHLVTPRYGFQAQTQGSLPAINVVLLHGAKISANCGTSYFERSSYAHGRTTGGNKGPSAERKPMKGMTILSIVEVKGTRCCGTATPGAADGNVREVETTGTVIGIRDPSS